MEYIFTFLEGIASFISPCMLPMVPIYISYFAGNDEQSKRKTMKTFFHSVGFVIGFTIAFMILAILASALGTVISLGMQYVKIFFGLLMIALGLNYMGIIQIRFLNQTKDFKKQFDKINFMKMILFGMLFSISWTPCVGAFLSSALMLIAREQNMIKGILLILTYSSGLGIPFIISAVLIEQLKSTFHFIKKHYSVIKKISGMVLIVMGLYMIFL